MARTDLKLNDDYWVESYNDEDLDDRDEYQGGSKVNGQHQTVHASDTEVEHDDEEELNFGTNKYQYKAFDETNKINNEEYMTDQDGSNCWSQHLDDMRRWS